MNLTWRGHLPVSTVFDDPYYNQDDGLAESRFVFLRGTSLPDRLPCIKQPLVAELGFGTGLNFLATWQLAQQLDMQSVHYISIEKYPLAPADMQRALAAFPDIQQLATALLAVYTPAGGCFQLDGITLNLQTGAAADVLAKMDFQAHAWFLDGFAPAKNPDMWSPELMQHVARLAAPGCVAATFTAARTVRDALQDAGFEVERLAGYGRKRHMVRAVKGAGD